ncbi:MAG: translin family protein, partial [Patescibacteria group bacterium]
MINQKLFQQLKKDFEFYGEERRKLIAVSNEALTKSKQAIFSFHRDDLKSGNSLLTEVEKIFQDLEKKFKQEPELRYEGAYRAALEEYVEAKFFGRFLEDGKIDFIKGAEIDADTYLGGLCDFTGELVRKAVLAATDKKFKKVEELAASIRDVIGELIKMNLTGYLRTKYDQAKNNLRRV